MIRYRVTWRCNPSIPVDAEVEGYGDLGVSFEYQDTDEGPELVRIVHEAPRVRDGPDDQRSAEERDRPDSLSATAKLHLRTQIGRGTVDLPAAHPLAARDPRLRDWLAIANDANNATNDVHALRGYFMILEDIHNGDKSKIDDGVRFTRDLVSHGEPLRARGDAAVYLRRQLKLPASAPVQFQPHDWRQAALVAKARKRGQELVTAALDAMLGK